MLNCRHITEQASEYLDGDLSVWQRCKVKVHLFICVNCRRYAQQLAQTVQMVEKMPQKEAKPEMEQQIKEHYQKVMASKGEKKT